MSSLRTYFAALLLVIAPMANAVTAVQSGEFGFTEGTLSALSGVHFDATFVYDSSNVTFSQVFNPSLAVYVLDQPASVSVTVAGLPSLSFVDNGMEVFVENDHAFGGFDWIPDAISDFYWLSGYAPGAVFDSEHDIISGLGVSLAYVGSSAMLADNGLAGDLPGEVFNANTYNPGFFVLLEELDNGNSIGTAFWNIGPAAVVPVPAAVWLFVSGLFGLLALARIRV